MSRLDQLEIRPLKNNKEFLDCLNLQKRTWGETFQERADPPVLIENQMISGITSGAFDPDGNLIGFIFGLTGIQSGRPVHWSDMMAVEPEWRRFGLGRSLKYYQQRAMRDIGVEEIYWSFDPLETNNANLNLNRLGVYVEEYVVDMYPFDAQEGTLHGGLGMDRFVVKWYTDHDRNQPGMSWVEISDAQRELPVINTRMEASGEITPVEGELPEHPALRIEIPESIQGIKSESREQAFQWRLSTRHGLNHYVNRGYGIRSFVRDSIAQRYFYVLENTAGIET